MIIIDLPKKHGRCVQSALRSAAKIIIDLVDVSYGGKNSLKEIHFFELVTEE